MFFFGAEGTKKKIGVNFVWDAFWFGIRPSGGWLKKSRTPNDTVQCHRPNRETPALAVSAVHAGAHWISLGGSENRTE